MESNTIQISSKTSLSNAYDDVVRVDGDDRRSSNTPKIYYGFGVFTGVAADDVQKLKDELAFRTHTSRFTEVSDDAEAGLQERISENPTPMAVDTVEPKSKTPQVRDLPRQDVQVHETQSYAGENTQAQDIQGHDNQGQNTQGRDTQNQDTQDQDSRDQDSQDQDSQGQDKPHYSLGFILH